MVAHVQFDKDERSAIAVRKFTALDRRDQKIRTRLHEIAMERMELENELGAMRLERNQMILDTRNVLPRAQVAALLRLNTDTVREILNREMKNRGMGPSL